MEITENNELRESIFDSVRETVVGGTREGIHISDLVFCVRKAYFRKKGLAPKPSDELCLLWLTGYAFQSYMFPKVQELTIYQNGIYCTPDVPSGVEVKSTRQSSKKFDLSSMTHWIKQILGYMSALNTTEYDLAVLFVCGNYSPPFPELKCWHIKATQEEIEQNWKELKNRADILTKALETNTVPEPDCAEWEWEYCECIENCKDTPCYRKKELKERK